MWRVDPVNGQWDDFRCEPYTEPLSTGDDTQWALWVVIYVGWHPSVDTTAG